MKPADLTPGAFANYPEEGRAFAVQHIDLLQRLPLAICPSFLKQILVFDSSFPAERFTLEQHCNGLKGLSRQEFNVLLRPFELLTLTSSLFQSNWISDPTTFIADLTSFLWSSGQIDCFRDASRNLFSKLPSSVDSCERLTLVVIGRDAPAPKGPIFQKLRRLGVLLTNVQHEAMPRQLLAVFAQRAASDPKPYSHWYVDGGDPWVADFSRLAGVISTSYAALDPLRQRTLNRMQHSILSGDAGAEQMRAALASVTPHDLGASAISADPVLQHFYTDLFTQSSGPQVFSTTFVQWTGRELARRVQPRTLLLRYAPRQHYLSLNQMIDQHPDNNPPDAEGSLRDADIGAYYTWLEMERVTAPGRGVLVVWLESSPMLLIVSANAPAGSTSTYTLSLEQALRAFG